MASKSFSVQVREWCEQTKGDMQKAFQAFSMEMGIRLIMRSPVDTGRFRGNWRISINNQDVSFDMEELDPGGSAAIARVRKVAERAELGDIVWVTNNLPYAIPLEYGWSAQAPGGMVRLTALELEQFLKQAVASGS